MDNLTHSLAGAILGQAGLKRKTGLAMPALIIGANIPDIDAIAVLWSGHTHLAFRRGITHGPIALLLLPILLWAILLWVDRWQTKRGTRPESRLPVHRNWLLALCFIGTLSHPALDWMNNYGIRLLEPFSSQWFYGDTLFIIDLWLWIALGLGVWLSLRRERQGKPRWQAPACGVLALTLLYIGSNLWLSRTVAADTRFAVAQQNGSPPDLTVASPIPLAFWQRETLWRAGPVHGQGLFDLANAPPAQLAGQITHRSILSDPAIRARLDQSADARAFLFWARMPVATLEGNEIVLRDYRFMHPMVGDRFTVRVPRD